MKCGSKVNSKSHYFQLKKLCYCLKLQFFPLKHKCLFCFFNEKSNNSVLCQGSSYQLSFTATFASLLIEHFDSSLMWMGKNVILILQYGLLNQLHSQGLCSSRPQDPGNEAGEQAQSRPPLFQGSLLGEICTVQSWLDVRIQLKCRNLWSKEEKKFWVISDVLSLSFL